MTSRRLKVVRLRIAEGAVMGVVMAAVMSAVLLSACATPPAAPSRLAPLQAQAVVSIPDLDVRTVSPEMDAFLDAYVGQIDNADQRVWKLVWAASDRNVLPFRYDPSKTLTAAEAFLSHSGNCLAFSNMLVAMARSIGLKAWYQEVEVPPQWTSSNDMVLVSMHINVVLKGRDDEWVVDISGERVNAPRKIRRIPDAEALAQHYNNLGANALVNGNLATAYGYYRKAIGTSPELSYLWSNLGVVYKHNGQTEDARRAYLQALKIDPGQATAANNLLSIYQEEGNFDAARRLQTRVDRYRRKNPYYLYHLSSLAAEQGHYGESVAMLQKAIRMNDNEYRFHYELARSQAFSGDLESAQSSLERALELAPDNSPITGETVDDLVQMPE